jgi:hypothetical protein
LDEAKKAPIGGVKKAEVINEMSGKYIVHPTAGTICNQI